MLKWLRSLWQDQRGVEGEAAEAEPADGGESASGAEPIKEDGNGQGGTTPPDNQPPKYGDFGDNPSVDDVFGAFSKMKSEYDNFRNRAGLTERNLASTRKALESSGLKLVQNEDGGFSVDLIEPQQPKRQSRFNEESLNKLARHFQNDPKAAQEFVDLVALRMQDEAESIYDAREKTLSDQQRERQAMIKEQTYLNNRMVKMFPMIVRDSKDFNQALYDRATQIWIENYRKHPLKEFYAVMDAADELGISAAIIQQAKKEGFEIGKSGKKVIGPVDGKSKGPAAGGKLSKEEYLALSPEEKLKYDKGQLKL